MKFYSSPTKTLKSFKQETTKPLFFDKTQALLSLLQAMDEKELSALYQASDKIVHHQYENLKKPHVLGPAGWVYQGQAFKQLNIKEMAEIDYLRSHLIIGSALYGITTIDTEIIDHRLDLLKKLKTIDLVAFWQPHIKNMLKDELIINCASNEYRQLIDGLQIIDIIFLDDGQIKSTYAKQARGMFIRQASINKVKDVQELKFLNIFNYQFNDQLSNEKSIYFTR